MKITALLALLFSISTFASSEDLAGAYLGKMPRCGVEATLEGDNKIRFTLINKKGEDTISETVPLYILEEAMESGTLKYEKEFYGNGGKAKVYVTGTIKRDRLRSITIKKVRSFFSFDQDSCSSLTTVY